MFISIKEQFIIIRCTSIGGNKDMILKYKNEYNDYYEFLTFQLSKRLNLLEKRKYFLIYLLVPFMIVFLYGWSKGYATDIKLISNFIFCGIVMVIRVKYSI